MVITGGCLCGAVRYEAQGEPMFAVLCHCRDCQWTSGTGHVPVMGMPKALFKVTGETRSYTVRGGSGLKAVRHFCRTCCSLLFGTPEVAAKAVTIYVGTLDDPSMFRPQLVMFTRNRHSWDKTLGQLREFDTVPTG